LLGSLFLTIFANFLHKIGVFLVHQCCDKFVA
jgi:hypothetical protein